MVGREIIEGEVGGEFPNPPWQPIASVPTDRVVEIATFPLPVGAHTPNMTIGANISLAYPEATHWREMTPQTAKAAMTPKQ